MRNALLPGFVVLAATLSSCCWDCAGNDGYEILNLAFSVDSLSGRGYRRAELRTAYVVRYTDRQARQVLDTLRQPNGITLYWPQGQLGLLYVAAPTAALAPAHSFRVVVPAAARAYNLTEVDVRVDHDKCGCTNAYLRGLTIDGQRRETTSTTQVLLEK
ncbi:hypothetical protein LJ737_12380 [Hymenobacter sp. 15J16-1T3B]|uniref:hypothetical protein n=1 Tax=Hymenobacter sp. 15J16-1T3B TaxID=2886941 RepID=UPI001D11B122|nr:hypothetical protein [Hymenobacter sp. 15J16-1T3B]MCC3158038.1 hypothetical protein [Hymenobacter sp. 15J16-1T3B]